MRLLPTLICAALLLAYAAHADTRLLVEGDDDDLRAALEAASVLHGGFDPGTPVPDQIAVARAEYGRLLAILYDRGHFSGVISIRIDGREAADISPFPLRLA